MSEAEVVDQLVNFTNILLAGISVLFTVISAYIAALNYFIGSANLIARLSAFLFLTLILGMLAVVMIGAQFTHEGLIARLYEIKDEHGLSAAGRSLLANSAPEAATGGMLSIDDTVRAGVWCGFALIYLALFYMTFFHRWKDDVRKVVIENQKAA
ncbi:MAG TPA: hypothetical protein VG841_10895 [Caulobacterales bacterium]|nr:hypothetical protein [Caulobacterales bacterium]